MVELITQVTSQDWQLALGQSQAIVEGQDDIAQCIDTIMKTQLGSDPLRPTFGTNYDALDQPINIAAPRMVQSFTDAINIWEKRAKVKKIFYTIEESRIVFTNQWTSKYGDGSSEIPVTMP